MSFFSKLALTIGTAASLVAVTAPASARPYFGGGWGGYHGYRHDNSGALLVGALAIGGIAALAATSHPRHDYYDGYRGDGYYRGGPVYGYDAPPPPPPPPPPPYEGGYYGSPYRGGPGWGY